MMAVICAMLPIANLSRYNGQDRCHSKVATKPYSSLNKLLQRLHSPAGGCPELSTVYCRGYGIVWVALLSTALSIANVSIYEILYFRYSRIAIERISSGKQLVQRLLRIVYGSSVEFKSSMNGLIQRLLYCDVGCAPYRVNMNHHWSDYSNADSTLLLDVLCTAMSIKSVDEQQTDFFQWLLCSADFCAQYIFSIVNSSGDNGSVPCHSRIATELRPNSTFRNLCGTSLVNDWAIGMDMELRRLPHQVLHYQLPISEPIIDLSINNSRIAIKLKPSGNSNSSPGATNADTIPIEISTIDNKLVRTAIITAM
ncbi:hypothetical protein WN48_08012 [Eufriesea mexicana]|nr:hypothetical protein WN48_08012 [Eufriesea mexicana]